MVKFGHIQLEVSIEGIRVLVDDYELCDYVEDFLTDKGFEYDFRGEEELRGQRMQVLYFSKRSLEESLRAALRDLPESEVERIWRINASKS